MALIDCAECGRQVSDKAAACPNCGAPPEKVPAPPQTMGEPSYHLCPHCDARVGPQARTCINCGHDFASAGDGPTPVFVKTPSAAAPPTGAAQAPYQPHMVVTVAKSRGVYIILGLLLGLLGIHNFYAGRYGAGVVQLLLTLLLGWIVIGLVIVVPWILIELIVVTKDGNGNAFS